MRRTNNFFDEPYNCAHAQNPERLEQLKYHLETGDYFPLLSTIMGFMEEAMYECQTGTLTLAPMEAEVIRQMREDLIHLHNHYEIRPKAATSSSLCAS